jgi:hypothetical protein
MAIFTHVKVYKENGSIINTMGFVGDAPFDVLNWKKNKK